MNSRNGIIGFAIGDAFGVPLKFMSREKLFENPTTQMIDGGSHDQPLGTWSDETSTTLATMESIIKSFGISTIDIGNRLTEWMEHSKYTAGGERFDCSFTF